MGARVVAMSPSSRTNASTASVELFPGGGEVQRAPPRWPSVSKLHVRAARIGREKKKRGDKRT